MKEQKTFLSNLSLWKPVKRWWKSHLYVLWNLLLPTYKHTLQVRYFFFWYYPNRKYIKNILAAKINSAQTLPMTDWDFLVEFHQLFNSFLQLLFYPSSQNIFSCTYSSQMFMGVSEMNPVVLRKLAGVVDRPLCIIFEKSQQCKYTVTGKREISHQFSKWIKRRTIGSTSQLASPLCLLS